MSSSNLPTREWWRDYNFPGHVKNQYFADLLDEDDVRKFVSKSKFPRNITLNKGISKVNNTGRTFQIILRTDQFKLNEIEVSVNEDFIVVKATHCEREEDTKPGHTIYRALIRKYPLPSYCKSYDIGAHYYRDILVITAPLYVTRSNYNVPIMNLEPTEDVTFTTDPSSSDKMISETLPNIQAEAEKISGNENHRKYYVLSETSRLMTEQVSNLSKASSVSKVRVEPKSSKFKTKADKAYNSALFVKDPTTPEVLSDDDVPDLIPLEPVKSVYNTADKSKNSREIPKNVNYGITLKNSDGTKEILFTTDVSSLKKKLRETLHNMQPELKKLYGIDILQTDSDSLLPETAKVITEVALNVSEELPCWKVEVTSINGEFENETHNAVYSALLENELTAPLEVESGELESYELESDDVPELLEPVEYVDNIAKKYEKFTAGPESEKTLDNTSETKETTKNENEPIKENQLNAEVVENHSKILNAQCKVKLISEKEHEMYVDQSPNEKASLKVIEENDTSKDFSSLKAVEETKEEPLKENVTSQAMEDFKENIVHKIELRKTLDISCIDSSEDSDSTKVSSNAKIKESTNGDINVYMGVSNVIPVDERKVVEKHLSVENEVKAAETKLKTVALEKTDPKKRQKQNQILKS